MRVFLLEAMLHNRLPDRAPSSLQKGGGARPHRLPMVIRIQRMAAWKFAPGKTNKSALPSEAVGPTTCAASSAPNCAHR
jgi:hypothetical protein